MKRSIFAVAALSLSFVLGFGFVLLSAPEVEADRGCKALDQVKVVYTATPCTQLSGEPGCWVMGCFGFYVVPQGSRDQYCDCVLGPCLPTEYCAEQPTGKNEVPDP